MEITFHEGRQIDLKSIAGLHARSWQKFYRGALSDTYLNEKVHEDRLNVWAKRLTTPSVNQKVFVAKSNGTLVGFICIFKSHDPKWGALIDNLHIDPNWQRKGLGAQLMKMAFKWVADQNPTSKFYLWVLADNQRAISFYKTCGGILRDTKKLDDLGGQSCEAVRVTWTNHKELVQV